MSSSASRDADQSRNEHGGLAGWEQRDIDIDLVEDALDGHLRTEGESIMNDRFRPIECTSKPVSVTALQWDPDDLVRTGVMVGWLMSHGISFRHPSGSGGTTTLQLGDYRPIAPGGWVVKRADGRFDTLTDDEFRAAYDVPAAVAHRG